MNGDMKNAHVVLNPDDKEIMHWILVVSVHFRNHLPEKSHITMYSFISINERFCSNTVPHLY